MKNTYAMAYACMQCCKSFKRNLPNPIRDPKKMVCPECGEFAYNFGRHFKPPKKSNKKQWEKVRFLFDHGFWFQKIRPAERNVDSIPYPETLSEAKEFVVKYKDFAWPQQNGT